MTWNHRVLAHEHKGELTFAIHEIFYSDDGIPNMCTENAVGVVGDTLPELSATLRLMPVSYTHLTLPTILLV